MVISILQLLKLNLEVGWYNLHHKSTRSTNVQVDPGTS